MLARADKYQVSLIQPACVVIAHVHHLQRDTTLGGRVDHRVNVDIGEAQQREP